MKWLVNLGLVTVAPAILYWQYHDVKELYASMDTVLENQIRLSENQVLLAHQNALIEKELRWRQNAPPPPPSPSVVEPYRLQPIQPVKRLEVVQTKNVTKHSNKDLFCMAKNIYHEAAFEPDLGKYAVAQITLNRKYNPKYPKTICDVVMDPYQFSWANNHKIRWTQPNGPAWEEAKRVAENVVVNGYRVKGLETGMFYHADYVSPKWRDDSSKITKIGRHIFYSNAL